MSRAAQTAHEPTNAGQPGLDRKAWSGPVQAVSSRRPCFPASGSTWKPSSYATLGPGHTCARRPRATVPEATASLTRLEEGAIAGPFSTMRLQFLLAWKH